MRPRQHSTMRSQQQFAIRRSLTLTALLLLMAPAHYTPAHALSSGPNGEQSQLCLSKTIYERGTDQLRYDSTKSFYMKGGQCTAVIEGNNLPCEIQPELPPLRILVEAQYEALPAAISISDGLDRIEITRQDTCESLLTVNVKGACLYRE